MSGDSSPGPVLGTGVPVDDAGVCANGPPFAGVAGLPALCATTTRGIVDRALPPHHSALRDHPPLFILSLSEKTAGQALRPSPVQLPCNLPVTSLWYVTFQSVLPCPLPVRHCIGKGLCPARRSLHSSCALSASHLLTIHQGHGEGLSATFRAAINAPSPVWRTH